VRKDPRASSHDDGDVTWSGSGQLTAHSWRESDQFVPRRLVRPLQHLMAVEASSAVAVLAATVLALVVANSGLAHLYHDLWETAVRVQVSDHVLVDLTLHGVVNDALMAVFFLLVSMEIKRELVFGELRDPRTALLPIAAAIGGMVVPAGIYAAFNAGGASAHGWGIPMATDIAFAVAVVSALGRRVPAGARLFLLTLAIVDDLGAILVIAIFYAGGLSFGWLALAALTVGLAVLARARRVRAMPWYIALGALCWYALLQSGVHATIAGVIFGLLTPAYAWLPPKQFPRVAKRLVGDLARRNADGITLDEQEANDHTLRELRRLSIETQSPLHRVESRLSPIVAFGIVPIFAFANAGVTIPTGRFGDLLTDPVVLGIAIGLVVGKTVGVFGLSWVLLRTGVARMPEGVTQSHLFGAALCAGIGFTVAIFVAGLAFTDPAVIETAKLAIILASAVAAVLGYVWLRATAARERPRRPATSATGS
jgi:NhaA family Na+:H+ antiporter